MVLITSSIITLLQCHHSLVDFIKSFTKSYISFFTNTVCSRRDRAIVRYYIRRWRFIAHFFYIIFEMFIAYGFIIDLYDGGVSDKPLVLYVGLIFLFILLATIFFIENKIYEN